MAAQPSCLPSPHVWGEKPVPASSSACFPTSSSFPQKVSWRVRKTCSEPGQYDHLGAEKCHRCFSDVGVSVFVKHHNECNRFPFILYFVERLEQRDKQLNFQIQPVQMVIPASTTLLMPLSRKWQISLLDSTGNCSCVFYAWHSQQQHISSALPTGSPPQHQYWNEHLEGKKWQFHLQACLCSRCTEAASKGLISDYD